MVIQLAYSSIHKEGDGGGEREEEERIEEEREGGKDGDGRLADTMVAT